MLTKEQTDTVKRALARMEKIVSTTQKETERFYYWGQMDGIKGFLELLGVTLDE